MKPDNNNADYEKAFNRYITWAFAAVFAFIVTVFSIYMSLPTIGGVAFVTTIVCAIVALWFHNDMTSKGESGWTPLDDL